MSKHDPEQVSHSRRQFLIAARGVGALSAIAILFGKGAAAPVAARLPAAPEDAAAGGYRESEHVRKYYRSARYW